MKTAQKRPHGRTGSAARRTGRPKNVQTSARQLAGLPAREAAVRLLRQVLHKSQPLDDALQTLDPAGENAALEPRDRAFARAIAATALRRRGQIQDLMARFIDKPLPDDRGALDEILLCGAVQLLFLATPPHAAINIAVEQARRRAGTRRFAKLVNAVLRRITREGAELVASQDAPRLNTPDWLWQRWIAAYGEEVARAIATQHLQEPPLDLSVKSDPKGWAERLGGIALATGTVRLVHKGRVEEMEGYPAGEWWVQDAAAALPARLLGDVSGLRVADLCAAPGGKTAQLAHAGATVVAVDISGKRLRCIRENLDRLGLTAELVETDAAAWRPDEPFDAVLLDAPCSSTGTIRRHPDVACLKTPDDIAELAALQHRLLAHAVNLLRPGGRLVYCTCSLEPEEGPQQIERLLAEQGKIQLAPVSPEEVGGHGEWIEPQGWLRTLPHQLRPDGAELGGLDGFFAARLCKRG